MAADVGINGNFKLREFDHMTDCFNKTYMIDGIRGFYRGFFTSVGGIALYRGAYFGMFDTGKVIFFPDARKANVFLMWIFA
jgi:solute carrier family 25 (adenine nucleotide translocator) protein 4/5/6/31